jgi:2-methylisocitrate lyase-like PEP mutase family enzyme
MTAVTTKAAVFRALHEKGCFVIPNPWDRGSARLLAQLGFPALATSSAAFAFSRGLPDTLTALSCDAVLEHVRDIVEGTDLPVSADFQAGFADDAEGVRRNVRRCIETGVAGLSIEDASGDPAKPLFELEHAIDRMRAARAAIDESGTGVVLTGRAECHLVGHPQPLQESIRRLVAYAEAGADVLFAPGLRDRDAMRAVIDAVAPKPVNILISGAFGLRVSDVAELGARRVSVGSALARVAWTSFLDAARDIAENGDFAGFEGIASTQSLSERFAT